MSNGLPSRVWKFLYGQDIAWNGLLGGTAGESLSGSVGRALQANKAWAPDAEAFVDFLFGKGHCVRQAALEAARRAASLTVP